MRRRVFVFLGVLLVAGPAWAVDSDVKCGADKIKEAVKYAFCLGKAEAKGIKKGEPADVSKCDSKFSGKWQKAELKAAGACPTNGDEATIEAQVQLFVEDLVTALEPGGALCTGGGVEVGGACWFLGNSDESCDTVCSNAFFSYDAATETYAGTGGSLLQCYAVMDALGQTSPPLFDGGDLACGAGGGCGTDGGSRARCTDVPTNSSATLPGISRACACQ